MSALSVRPGSGVARGGAGDGARGPAWLQLLAGLALLFGLAVSVWVFMGRDGFSEDEFFQLTFINESLPRFFVQFVRLDQHPFFHFLQLKLWGLVSDGDTWMLANSLVWHLLSCAVLVYVGRAWQGWATGLLAAAMYVLLPQVVAASVSLRMYAMIPALVLLSWWLNYALLTGRERRAWAWWLLAAVQLALCYSHAVAFFFAFFVALSAAGQTWFERPRQPAWRRWLGVQAVVALLALPLPLLAVARILMVSQAGTSDGGNSDPGGIVEHFGGMVMGWGLKWPEARVAGTALFMSAIALGLWQRSTRWVAVGLLVGPYAVAFVVGMFLAPMFKTPVYSAMLVPFACLVLATGLLRLPGGWAAVAPAALLVALAAAVVPASTAIHDVKSPYRDVAQTLLGKAQAGDIVVIPKPYVYWATLRYAVGPEWGSALQVLPALNDSWLRLTQKLGPAVTGPLGLIPRAQQVEHQGIVYVIGEDAVAASSSAQRVWFVRRVRYPEVPKLAAGFGQAQVVHESGRPETVQILLYQKAVP